MQKNWNLKSETADILGPVRCQNITPTASILQ